MRVNLMIGAAIGSIGAMALHAAGRRLRQQAHMPSGGVAPEPAPPEQAVPVAPAPQHDVALRAAAERGDVAAVEWLLAAAPAAAMVPNAQGRLPLHLACQNGHTAVAQMLAHAAPQAASALDNFALTPLYMAAVAGNSALVELLLSAAPDAATQSCGGSLPIHGAAAAGHAQVVRMLAEAEPRAACAADADGSTPLQLALDGEHIDIARLLLNAGSTADVLPALCAAGEPAQPLFAQLISNRPALTAEDWALVPTPCPGLGHVVPAVMARSPDQAAQLVAHLPADEVQAFRDAGILPAPSPVRDAAPPQGLVARVLSTLRRRKD